jgi:predicted ThiF/HesA family dinucleotide-utilizing enzyme
MPVATKKDGTEYESYGTDKYIKDFGGLHRYIIDGVTGKLIKKVLLPKENLYY